ncbi:TIGR01906 family membrane protein [Streptococcus himalayensis]|uniref:Membrane protein n=1 Tax=Streptococcus himalayensis TaxID=1888195 RepID=A0A917EGX5_9STRE|nr:TIGR01906 family membrane protein [Streptococcus himalayensis]GGE38181.1 membrane protein [Streptococcus himalayensis]
MRIKWTFIASQIWLLALAILLTIYLMWLVYPIEIRYLHLSDQTYLSQSTIAYNFTILMNYLTNPFVQVLAMPDFRSSAAGVHHFQAVKWLFHLVQALSILLLPFAYLFYKKVIKAGYFSLFTRKILGVLLTPLVIGLAALGMGFDLFFTLFHQILFVGDDTWLFDPRFDPVIRILPEELFLHAFLLFFVLYEGMLIVLYIWSRQKKGEPLWKI